LDFFTLLVTLFFFPAQGTPDPGSQFDVVVAPAVVRLKGGESQKVTITIKPRPGTPPNEYQFGEVSEFVQ
jgi:P pilus assembly chaperone PapD